MKLIDAHVHLGPGAHKTHTLGMLQKVRRLQLGPEKMPLIYSENIQRLVGRVGL